MALTATEEARILAIETAVNKLLTMVNNLAPKEMVKASMLLRQKEIDDLKTTLAAIQSQLQILQETAE